MRQTIFTLITITSFMFMVQSSSAQDWPNLGRFEAQNLQLGKPKANENRVVFMGNSITEGWLQDSMSFFHTKSNYINRGISGQTTPQMLIRFRPDVIDLAPSVVVILAGINDIAGNTGPSTLEMIVNNLISMVELAQANEIKVVLCSVLPAYDFPWRPGLNPATKVVELNNRLQAYAEKTGIVYLDYFSKMVNAQNGLDENLTYDGVHPNMAGYKVMQPLAEEAIKKALSQQ